MKYRFILTYQATDSETTATRTCFPLHGNDLSISIDRAEGEWYYTRNLDGKLVFERDDYNWIMGQEFDGTFTLDIKESHDNGATFYDYFTGTFSRASLEIDEDNHQSTLNGLKEGVEDLIKNGAKEDYDLMKLIPDSNSKIVQGIVHPALALIDYNSTSIVQSDVYCGGPSISNGYKSGENDFDQRKEVRSNASWSLEKVCVEAKVTMIDHNSECEGIYIGFAEDDTDTAQGNQGQTFIVHSYKADLRKNTYNNQLPSIYITIGVSSANYLTAHLTLYDSSGVGIDQADIDLGQNSTDYYTPTSFLFTNSIRFARIEITYHYIRTTLLTQSGGNTNNVLNTGDYYKRMSDFHNDGGLVVDITTNTTEQPNGHRMLPGSDDYGGIPQYFAPPDESGDWIPLAENEGWNYASMWYKITPSVANGLLDPTKIGSFSWTRCWTIGTCLQFLLQRITDGKVIFSESTYYSQFLYGNPNPVQGHEPFQWLITQKSNVMHPAATGAARCIVRLDWFFELLRNAFNCYYWFERRNDGRYDFRIEHIEYFRRGGAYNDDLADQLDLTRLKPYRNFLRNGQPAKRYADQTNKYTFDLDGMVEKYTYSWQGDGGSDDFKGNPMYLKAGWIEKGSSDDRQVDNIFADLGWLMLNAGTDTASSKNYDGLFLFGGYQPTTALGWKENEAPLSRYMNMPNGGNSNFYCVIWLTIPEGQEYLIEYTNMSGRFCGTGKPQAIIINNRTSLLSNNVIRIDFGYGGNYQDIVIHRIHSQSGNIFRVPNVTNLLRTENTLQNGVLAWPWLQCEYLHYDIPAAKWTYLKDDYTDGQTIVWEETGTIKMVKKQDLAVVPVLDASTEDAIMGIMGVKTGLGIGIIDNTKINLSSRNAEMTIIYDINPQNQ